MQPRLILSAMALALLKSTMALAVAPPAPGMTGGSGDNGMKHAGISLSGNSLSVHYESVPAVPLVMTSGHGMDYTPAKFDVLEGNYFSAQYGWVPDGFLPLPMDRAIWLRRTAVTQPASSNFAVYEGGNMAEGMDAWTMNPVYAADGDIWQWDAVMQHDYYVADSPGAYSMSFDVYVGDSAGVEDTSYAAASTTFQFTVVPEPSSLVLLVFGLSALAIRRN